MIWSGHSAYNKELQHHGSAAIGLVPLATNHTDRTSLSGSYSLLRIEVEGMASP